MNDVFVFYANWNGAQVRDLFEGLVAVTNASGFAQLATFLVVTGLVGALLLGSVRGQGRHVIEYFACAVLFWFVAIVPKTTLVIEDVRSRTVYNVDNVPLSMAFFASASSRIGHWLTQTYETAFIPVDVARYASFGAVYPERVMDVLQRTGPVTLQGRETLHAVLKNCVLPEVTLDAAKADQVLAAGDLWSVIRAEGWVNPARLAVMPDGSVKKCSEAMNELEAVLNDVELPALQRWVGLKLNPEDASPAASVAAGIVQSESLLMGISRSAESSLKHSLVMTTLPQVMAGHAVNTAGPAAMASTLARSQGNLAGEINYRTMARMAEDSLPKIRNALEFVVIAMFPVVALVALVSGAGMGGVVRGYVTLLLTVQLWPALSSVVNYLVISHDAHPFTQLAQAFGGASLQTAVLVRETGASSQAIAGALLCAVPVISYALVRAGDVAVGQLVGALMQPAQAAASAQGASIASGNISQGNVSVANVSTNNTSSNKFDSSVKSTDPGMLVTQSGYGAVTRSATGEVTGLQRTAVSFGVGAQTQQSYVRGHMASNVGQTSTVTTDAARFSFSQSLSSNDSTQQHFAQALRNALSEQKALSSNYSDGRGWGSSVTLTHAAGMDRTSSVSEGTDYATRLALHATGNNETEMGAGVKSGFWVRSLPAPQNNFVLENKYKNEGLLDAANRTESKPDPAVYSLGGRMEGQLSLNDAQRLVDSATGKTSTQSGDSHTTNYQFVRSAAENVARNHSDESVRSYARNFVQSLDQTHVAGRDKTQSHSDSVSAVSTLNEVDSGSVMTSADASVPVMNYAVERYGSGEAALRAMYQSAEVASVAGAQHVRATSTLTPSNRIGPGMIVSANQRNAEVFDAAPANVQRTAEQNASHIEALSAAVRENAMPSRDELPGRQAFEEQYQQFVVRQQDANATRIRQMNFDRGVVLVAREAYNRENQDKNFALRNAFLAGWGYRNGDEIQEDLREWAGNSPALRERLEQIGASDKNHVSGRDWESLVEIARQPRGIRFPKN